MTKYIFMTGGVVSSLGKGLTSAAIAAILENRGLKVGIMKLDPYINVDPGTMSPFQHGEVFVTDDGTETDLDLGHYERFTNLVMTKNSNFTTGQVYLSVINRERRGEYLGKTVQVIPHITNEIKDRIIKGTQEFDIAIIEVGGTVGDIESLPFLESIRQLKRELGYGNAISIHMTLLPYLKAANELKTKPTQNSVRQLMQIGLQADFIVCRAEVDIEITRKIKEKISLFCNLPYQNVITANDVSTIYELPILLHQQKLDEKLLTIFNLDYPLADLQVWEDIVDKIKNSKVITTIGVVGKYVELTESYKSLNEALTHAGIKNSVKVNLKFISSEDIENNGIDALKDIDGILIPGGFGNRGVEGKILAVKFARENKIPFLGICLGMQIAVIEYARDVAKLKDANSTEFNSKTDYPVIDIMYSQKDITDKGATMRLGAYPSIIKEETLAYNIYEQIEISERHRHRYEFNNGYRDILEKNGLIISATSPDNQLVEMIEIKEHPFFIAVQFHPEFKSKPFLPHPLFAGFIKATLK